MIIINSKRIVYARGTTLPVVLIMLVVLTLLATASLNTAVSGARLSASLQTYQQAFHVAELQLTAGLTLADTYPATLPTTGALTLPRIVHAGTQADGDIRLIATDNFCPELAPLAAERSHYEITVAAFAPRAASSRHIRGFSVCREICGPPCVAAEGPVLPTYWRHE